MVESLEGNVRASLEEQRNQLGEQLGELTGSSFDENFADSAQVAAEQGEAHALAGSLQEQLDAVERALTKLDDGTYGVCEVCGERIADARLEAVPSTPFCVNHA